MKDLMKRWKLANEVIACITTVIIISILPLVFHDYYFDILDTKYYFYCGTVICMAAVMLLLTLIILRLNKGTIVMTPKLRKSDWAMIGFCFLLCYLVFGLTTVSRRFGVQKVALWGLFCI